jgi:hypothetical protein
VIARYLNALRGRSPAELRDRAAQNISILLERGGMLMKPPAVQQAGPVRLTSSVGSDSHAADFRDRWPAEADAILAYADRVMAGRFDLLGYSGIEWGTSPDWQLDPVSGRRAPMKHWSRVPYLDIRAVGDHKVTWELNRHQWMVTLAQAWRLTGKDAYAKHAGALLHDWIERNPPKRGINWASSLELAFRSVSWCWTLQLLNGAPAPDDDLRRRMLASLHLQGRHVERYLSTWFSPNTHLTGEALGLLYLGSALPMLPRAEHWREFGWRILLEESRRQIRDDGVYFEQTTWYQGYTVDFYLHAIRLRRAAGGEVPDELVQRVRKAAEVLAAVVRPDGSIPLFGDDDGGRLLPLRPHARDDFRDTLALAALVLNDPAFLPADPAPRAALAWIASPEELETLDRAHACAEPPAAMAFPDGGMYVIRDRQSHVVLDAGPHGALSGAHSHADALSITLALDGRVALSDPGTYTYLGEERDSFRGTAAHNTVEVDGQMSSEPGGPFRWETFARSEVLRWYDGLGFVLWEAVHDGYRRLPDPVLHRRVVLWLADRYGLVCDIIEGAAGSSHTAVARWHGAPGATARLETGQSCLIADDSGPLLRIVSDRDVKLQDGWSSSMYGRRQRSPVASIAWAIERGDAIVTALVPAASQVGPASCQVIAGEGGHAWRLDTQEWSDTWLVRTGTTLRAAGVEATTDLVWLRREGRGGAGRAVEVIASGHGVVRVDDIEVLTVRGGCARARRSENGEWTFEEI